MRTTDNSNKITFKITFVFDTNLLPRKVKCSDCGDEFWLIHFCEGEKRHLYYDFTKLGKSVTK